MHNDIEHCNAHHHGNLHKETWHYDAQNNEYNEYNDT
jgi:hypothetical protein